jgi:hypothetical protein
VRGRKFREWLRYQYFEKMESGCNAEAMQVAVETIAAKAQYQGDERQGGQSLATNLPTISTNEQAVSGPRTTA